MKITKKKVGKVENEVEEGGDLEPVLNDTETASQINDKLNEEAKELSRKKRDLGQQVDNEINKKMSKELREALENFSKTSNTVKTECRGSVLCGARLKPSNDGDKTPTHVRNRRQINKTPSRTDRVYESPCSSKEEQYYNPDGHEGELFFFEEHNQV